MTALSLPRMTVDEYLTWAAGKPGRYELYDGSVYAMSPEGIGHAKVKGAVYAALLTGIKAGGLPCHALPDGVTVRVDATTAFEPDALVYCGNEASSRSLAITNPMIIVEVLSPSTRRIDVTKKVVGYFQLPSVAHYLIIDPTKPLIVHHIRGKDDKIDMRFVKDGVIALEPPGLELALADVYGA